MIQINGTGAIEWLTWLATASQSADGTAASAIQSNRSVADNAEGVGVGWSVTNGLTRHAASAAKNANAMYPTDHALSCVVSVNPGPMRDRYDRNPHSDA